MMTQMKSRSLKLQIAATFIILLSFSMFMLSCVWVMLTKKGLIEKEVVQLENYVDSLAKELHVGDVACYRIQFGEVFETSKSPSCFTKEVNEKQVNEGSEGNKIYISYAGTQWAVLTFSHKNLIMTKTFSATNGANTGVVIIETSLEPIYEKIRDDWKIILFYLLINVIIFSSLGFFRMFKLVLKPINRLVDISEKHNSGSDLSFYSTNSNNEFSKLSLGLNRMVSRIQKDNKILSATVEELETANNELKRNENEMIRTEKLASIGRLSAGLAHEIGNPLGIIQGYVDMLGGTDLTDQEKQQFSERAGSELQRIDALIHQLLDMSRKVNSLSTTIHLQQLLQKVVDFFSLQKKNCEVQIITNLEAVNDRVAAQEDQLRQVFLNCLMNGVDAIEEGSGENSVNVQGKIDIFCENVIVEGEQFVQVRIVDNGPGVNGSHIDTIFDPFFTTKETGKGTGLGLYVSYTILESLGGSIRLNNCELGGAEIVIRLPCIKKDIKNHVVLDL